MVDFTTATRKAAAMICAVLLSLGLVVGATARAHASGNGPGVRVMTHGCPAYAFCLYPAGTGWNHDRPEAFWRFPNHGPIGTEPSSPQAHYWSNLHSVYGTRKVFNNGLYLSTCGTTWSEDVSINTGYNGGGKHFWVSSGRSYDLYMTPYNSITLWYFYYLNYRTCP